MPFNRAQRDWVARAEQRGKSNTIAFRFNPKPEPFRYAYFYKRGFSAFGRTGNKNRTAADRALLPMSLMMHRLFLIFQV